MSKASSIGKAIATLLVIAGVGAGGWYVYKNYASPEARSTDKVYVQKVSGVNTVTSAELFSSSFAGVIVTQKSVDVKYDTTKTIDEILVKEGDKVEKGDKLLTYDVEAIQIEIDTAQLEVERLEAAIETNNNQIKQYEEEKKKASQDAAVTYTTQILELQSNNARNEYDIKAKKVEISKLETSIKNAYVIAPIDGTVKELKEPSASNSDDYYSASDSPDVIMKLTAEGDMRVKGVFNEQNSASIVKDAPVILRSRVDDTTCKGVISEIDTSPQKSEGDNYYTMYGESDEQVTASKYAFYVEPESLDNFKLGQHILIDLDNGNGTEKTGIWLWADFVLKEGDKSYVWAKDKDKDKIEKRYIKTGEEDAEYGDIEILDGLSSDDMIAYPADYIREGLETTTNSSDKDIPDNDMGDMMGMDGMMGEMGGMEMNDDGSYTMTDEDGNTIESSENGTVITSPDGGVVEMDADGEFIRGSINDDGTYEFDYSGDAENKDDKKADEKDDSSEVPDLDFEEMYGISQEEFDKMSAEEQEEFLKDRYK
ncbi:MAG: efflux RND transporter periplasmic adaptor subunit [Ruminococcus sp.]|nr:efflux RND transporter periplasmic adaptor subunit [Ruminococcus sp.]